MNKVTVTAEEVLQFLSYEPDTGHFYWRVSRGGTGSAGSRAGSINNCGRLQIMLNGRSFHAHRLAWLITHGAMPEDTIDHINGDPADNRLCNLRIATHPQNCCNRKKPSTNTTGFKGVSPERGRFRANIQHQGKSIRLGVFTTAEAAHAAYCKAAAELHGKFARIA